MKASCTASRSSSMRSGSIEACDARAEASSPASSSLSGSMGNTSSCWRRQRMAAPVRSEGWRESTLGWILEGQVDLQEVDEEGMHLVLHEEPAEAQQRAGGE